MVDAEFLDTLEYIARKVRRNEEPFGGIQLIFSGQTIGHTLLGSVRSQPWFFRAFAAESYRSVLCQTHFDVFDSAKRAVEAKHGSAPSRQASLCAVQ